MKCYYRPTTFFSLMHDMCVDPSLFSDTRKAKLAYCRIATLDGPWRHSPMNKIGLRVRRVFGRAQGRRKLAFDIVLRDDMAANVSFVVDEDTDDVFRLPVGAARDEGGRGRAKATDGAEAEERHACD